MSWSLVGVKGLILSPLGVTSIKFFFTCNITPESCSKVMRKKEMISS